MEPEAAKGPTADDRARERLSSWKEIAAYLGATSRTVQRWERDSGLPVHRLVHQNRATVFAYKSELEAWLDARSSPGHEVPPATPVASPPVPPPASPVRNRIWVALACVGAVAALALLAASGTFWRETPPREPAYLELSLPTPSSALSVRLAPDGRRLVFAARDSLDAPRILWIHDLTTGQRERIDGTERAVQPFWAPDGSALGFFAEGKLRTLSIGSASRELADAPSPRGGTWSEDGVILFSPDLFSPIYAVPAAGGEPRPITALEDRGSIDSHLQPAFLPGGKKFLYSARRAQGSNVLMLGTLESNETQTIVESDAQGEYVAPYGGRGPGTLLHVRDGILYAHRFDPSDGSLSGDSVSIASKLSINQTRALAPFTVAADGTMVFAGERRDRDADPKLWWLDRKGKVIETVPLPKPVQGAALDPAGTRALLSGGGRSEAFLVDLAAGRASLLATEVAAPVWSHDGGQLALIDTSDGTPRISVTEPERFEPKAVAFPYEARRRPLAIAADGLLIYEENGDKSARDLYFRSVDGGKREAIAATPYDESRARLSPDGRWLAYVSDESGSDEVYVQPFPPTGARWGISVGGGGRPEWAQDSQELFYISGNGELAAVPYGAVDGRFSAGKTAILFPIRRGPHAQSYAVAPDGQRFLVTGLPRQRERRALTVVVNWRMPTE